MGKFSRLGNDLYGGRKSFDFIGRRSLWYAASIILVAVAIVVIVAKGLNFGIEFTGGTQYTVPIAGASQDDADKLREVVASSGVQAAENPVVTTAGGKAVVVQTEELTPAQSDQVREALAKETGVDPEDLSQTEIGASWGREVAERAVLGVIIFLVLVMLFIGVYFREWKMAAAAFVALFHDVAFTVGIYALSGFQVTPAAVTGLLAILGFSLYDTVVVFDKIKENANAMKRNRQTYAYAANLAVNQTLVRSVNTGIVALIPIGAILWVSASQLGASSLQDLALAQFVGMAVGVYSSIFLAPRVLVHLKSTESEVILAERRAKARAKQSDPYATVPVFTDDLPVSDTDPDDAEAVLDDEGPVSQPAGPRQPDAVGRGRTTPAPRRPVGESRSSGRQQPSRQTKSKRKKP
jgi:preprotein translocase subunit SecF